MTDTFRALCKELVETMEQLQDRLEEHYHPGEVLAVELDISARLLDRAQAALAEQPVGPTDEELCETYRTAYYAEKNRQGPHCMAAGLRAVLARWGQS